MAAINLLPIELAPKGSFIKLSKVLKKISIIGYSGFLVFLIVTTASFFLVNKQLKEHLSKEEDLVVSIKALQETERKLLLTQDRLKKANTIMAEPNAKEEIENLEKLIEKLPDGVSFRKSELHTNDYSVTFMLNDSDTLGDLISAMTDHFTYKKITLSNLNLNTDRIFEAQFKITL